MNSSNNSLVSIAFSTPRSKQGGSALAAVSSELKNRALEIGIQDSRLMWIAQQSLDAKLPDDWVECVTEDGYIYYYNDSTHESVWEHPMMEFYKKLLNQQYALLVQQDKQIESRNNENSRSIPNQQSRSSPIKSPPPKDVWGTERSQATEPAQQDKRAQQQLPPKQHDKFPSYNFDEGKLEDDDDDDFWHNKCEVLAAEKAKIDEQVLRLEGILQKSVIEQSTLHSKIHALGQASEDCAYVLRKSGSKAIEFLEKKGFACEFRFATDNTDIALACDEETRLVDALMAAIESQPDDRGFAKSWEGLGLRLQSELHACFSYDSAGALVSTDTEELRVRIEVAAQLVATFGEYLTAPDRRGYMDLLLKHILTNATGDTMVPLNLVVSQLPEEHRSRTVAGTEADVGSGRLPIEPPSALSDLRSRLDEELRLVSQLQSQLEKKTHETELLQAKYTGSHDRLVDAQTREEAMFAKFSMLCKSMDEMRDLQKISSGAPGGTISLEPGVSASDVASLQAKVEQLAKEAEMCSRRAAEAESRYIEASTAQSDLRAEVQGKEAALLHKLERKRKQCQDLVDKNQELDKVAKEMYGELQKALEISAKLDEECEALRVENTLALEKGVHDKSDALRLRFEDEAARCKRLELTVAKYMDELEKAKHDRQRAEEYSLKTEAQIYSLHEELNKKCDECSSLQGRADRLGDEISRLIRRDDELKRENVRLNDVISDLQGNIRVFCRVRPVSSAEVAKSGHRMEDIEEVVKFPLDENTVDFNSFPYSFDRVFSPYVDQKDIFRELEPVVKGVMAGYRLCIFAYGQTGSGKTFTMVGPSGDRGVNLRAVATIFQIAESEENEVMTTVKVSIVECYNDKISDLLNTSDYKEDLEVRMGKDGGTFVENIIEVAVKSVDEVVELMNTGEGNRKTASNNVNEHSSRSHLVFIVKVDRDHIRTGLKTAGVMYLVDLAGSERVKLTSATGTRLREAQHINKSLSSLGDVISAMASGQKHVPYRNSKLTFLLQDTLRENSKVVMFVNINPMPDYVGESECSLKFATRCREVKLGKAKVANVSPAAQSPRSGFK